MFKAPANVLKSLVEISRRMVLPPDDVGTSLSPKFKREKHTVSVDYRSRRVFPVSS